MKIDIPHFNKYLILKNLSEKTIKEYLSYALRFQKYGAFNNETISDFLIDKPNQNNVARSFISILKKYLVYNRKELGLTEEEFKEIVESEVPTITGRKKKRINYPFTKEEMKLLEETLETERVKLMFLLCYNAGLRLQELVRIKLNDFNWNKLKENPEEIGEVRVLGKGNKERIALVPNWLMRRIADYVRSNPLEFKEKGEARLFKLSGDSFEDRLHKAGIKSGITKFNDRGEIIESTRVHPHKLRHQLGYDLAKAGVDIRYIQEILGHSSITSTQIYTQLSKEDLKDKLNSISKNDKL